MAGVNDIGGGDERITSNNKILERRIDVALHYLLT